jgi:post-segregation antitoxin (ccd killing protein)
MAKVQCYLPDELKARGEVADLNWSAILRKGVLAALRGEGAGGGDSPAPSEPSTDDGDG